MVPTKINKNYVRSWLAPLGFLYGEVMQWRNFLYQQKILPSYKVNCPVISVGNLSLGGTGKTPFVMWIAQNLQAQGLQPGIVSRGYGGHFSGVKKVNPWQPQAAYLFGDEPTLMAQHLKNVPVFVGVDRVATAQELLTSEKNIDILIADDGFQHRRLRRDLDIVILDGSQHPSTRFPLPWGLGREFWSEIQRADLCILNKINLSTPSDLKSWQDLLKRYGKSSWVEAEYHLSTPYPLLEGTSLTQSPTANFNPCFVVSGIGHPKTFLKALQQSFSLQILGEIPLADHQEYSPELLDHLSLTLQKSPWLTTEKDAVKLRNLKHPILNQAWVVPVKIHLQQGKEDLLRALDFRTP